MNNTESAKNKETNKETPKNIVVPEFCSKKNDRFFMHTEGEPENNIESGVT